jgi:6-phosphogluconolactonase (cycloisomerase 2 family)
MRTVPKLIGFAGLSAVACLSFTATASASPTHGRGAVFVQTQSSAGNRIVAYDRGAAGHLTQAGSVTTGGNGGTLSGAVVDKTASQGALTADRRHRELYAVNAGSDTISVLAVHGDDLKLRQVIDSGGAFPVSVTVHGDIVYVLNARNGGSIQGYLNFGGRLLKIDAWHRNLGLDETASPEFTHTPGQVSFTPDGKHLIVTTKASTNSILTYRVGRHGELSATPVVRTEAGAVPFAVTYDAAGHLVVADAGTNAISTYSVSAAGSLTPLSVTPTGQAATCWVTSSGNLLVASNAGSGTVTSLLATRAGQPTVLADTPTDAGTVDASFSPDGHDLYVQTGAAGVVDSYAVTAGGHLVPTGAVVVPDAVGGEGIVAY